MTKVRKRIICGQKNELVAKYEAFQCDDVQVLETTDKPMSEATYFRIMEYQARKNMRITQRKYRRAFGHLGAKRLQMYRLWRSIYKIIDAVDTPLAVNNLNQ